MAPAAAGRARSRRRKSWLRNPQIWLGLSITALTLWLTLRDVPASVNEAEMKGSLLGMSFLGLFARYEVRGGTLLLVPK